MPPEARPGIAVLLAVNKLGGAELSLIAIARGLQKAGFPVTLIAYGRQCGLLHEAAGGLTMDILAAEGSRAAVLPLSALLRKKRPAVLLCGLRHTNIAGMFAARLSGCGACVILTEHSPAEDGLKHRPIGALMRRIYPKADAVVAVSQGVARGLESLLGKQCRVQTIYNPAVKEQAPPAAATHPWLAQNDAPIVIGIGRLSSEKNFTLLISAFARALATQPMRLVILGEGEERATLEELARRLGIKEHVLFPGFVPEVNVWLAHAAVFVCSSRFEGFGNAIVEAMHARVPVIATDCPVGPREILDNGRFGHLVAAGDEAALADAIAATLKNPPDTTAAYARAQMFTEQHCIDAYSALIHTLVFDTPPSPSLWQRLRRKIASIVLHENWMIGWVDTPIETSPHWKTCPKVHWIGERSDKRYLADPFGWPGKPDTVLCEEYDFASRRGRIRQLTLNDGRIAQEEDVLLPLPGHLSFPYLFLHQGDVYCICESSGARRLVILRHGKSGFKECATPLADVAAADSVLFAHNGYFWIAYTDTDKGAFDNLNLCFAPSLTGPWQQHPLNPVKRDIRSARCAGTPFTAGGGLYRPAQDCSETYGGAIRIMRITQCTPERFREEEVNLIKPGQGLNPHGLHTLSTWENRCLVDGKRMIFSPRHIFAKVWRRLTGSR